jgi:serine O-acetyltransferase
MGIVINANVEIGSNVTIWHNVTLAAGPFGEDGGASAARLGARKRGDIVVEDNVVIGANAVLIAPRANTLRIGRGARIGAGAVITRDVPAGTTVVPAPVRELVAGERAGDERAEDERGPLAD